MKKIIILILCLICAVFVLASCNDEIGAYLEQYDYEEEEISEVTVHMYIPYEDGTSPEAIQTVSGRLSDEGTEKFVAKLVMHYVAKDEYEATVLADIEEHKAATKEMTDKLIAYNREISNLSGTLAKTDKTTDAASYSKTKAELEAKEEEKKGAIRYSVDLVLVNSTDMMVALADTKALTELSSFLSTDRFGQLNTRITKALLSAANTEIASAKYDGQSYKGLYAIPNDHILTTGYSILKIDKRARDELLYSPGSIASFSDFASAKAALGDYVELCENVRYEEIVQYKDEGYFVNILATPAVDQDEVFLSAFAVANAVDDTETKDAVSVSADRAMQIIYALNTDKSFHNLLQYGVRSTNYRVLSGAKESTTITRNMLDETLPVNSASTYKIDLLYAGSQFLSYFVKDGEFTSLASPVLTEWNARAEENGLMHNKSTENPIVPVEPEPVEAPAEEEG